FIRPTHVHIMIQGKIVKSGGFQLVEDLEQTGYDPHLLE
ncbi:MAG: Fe-S cluster assembly ATPase SufC, partial [Spirochaetota bacterium]